MERDSYNIKDLWKTHVEIYYCRNMCVYVYKLFTYTETYTHILNSITL